MANDKTFNIYAVILIGAAVSLVATLITVGIATAPTPLFLIEHVVIGLMIRAAYKSFDGPGWAIPGLGVSDEVEMPTAPVDALPSAG